MLYLLFLVSYWFRQLHVKQNHREEPCEPAKKFVFFRFCPEECAELPTRYQLRHSGDVLWWCLCLVEIL
jgi:hypothetical protein